MNKTETIRGKSVPSSPHNRTAGNARTIEREAAQDAAAEVAETTDAFMVGGMQAEAAAQAESLAIGDAAAPANATASDSDLTQEERREVSQSVFRLAWPAIAENALQT